MQETLSLDTSYIAALLYLIRVEIGRHAGHLNEVNLFENSQLDLQDTYFWSILYYRLSNTFKEQGSTKTKTPYKSYSEIIYAC